MQSSEQELARLRQTNRQLAQGHQQLTGIPAPLCVPPPPPAQQQLLSAAPPSAGVQQVTQELDGRRHKGGKRRAKRREPLTIESAYDVEAEGGRPAEVKLEMNAAVCEALRRCG